MEGVRDMEVSRSEPRPQGSVERSDMPIGRLRKTHATVAVKTRTAPLDAPLRSRLRLGSTILHFYIAHHSRRFNGLPTAVRFLTQLARRITHFPPYLQSSF